LCICLYAKFAQLETHLKLQQIMSLRFLGLSLYFIFTFSLIGKGQIRFEATTDAREIVAGNFFEVRFTLYDANGSNFSPPDFRPFSVVSGPNRSISTTSINGNVSHETSISYTLLAEKPGRWRVNPASITVKGKLYSTRAITIEVIESGKQKDPGHPGQEIFLIASVSDSVAYVGQQVLLDYTIYTTKNVESYNLLKESVYEGFFVEEIKRFNPRAVREVINGIQYTSKIIKRVALFPQQTGVIEIDPMMVQIGVEIEGSQPRSSFFFRRDLQYQNLGSNSLKVEVKSLPEGAPESFSGAVGRYEVNTNMGGTDLTTDDAFMLRLIIRGNGDEKRVSPPTLTFPDNFETYPPRNVRDNSQETVGEINHVKEIEYLAVAKKPGHYTIHPEFTYFDTDSLRYITLYPQPIHLNISQGNQKGSGINAEITGLKDIHPWYPSYGTRLSLQAFFVKAWIWPVLALPLFGMLFIYFKKKKIEGGPTLSNAEKRKKEADLVAKRRLAEAEKAKSEGDSTVFYRSVSTALFGYVCHKLEIPLADLTKQNAEHKLNQAGASATHINTFMNLVKTCELALFAGQGDQGKMEETYTLASELIIDLETSLH
jgi:hypothetical protein